MKEISEVFIDQNENIILLTKICQSVHVSKPVSERKMSSLLNVCAAATSSLARPCRSFQW